MNFLVDPVVKAAMFLENRLGPPLDRLPKKIFRAKPSSKLRRFIDWLGVGNWVWEGKASGCEAFWSIFGRGFSVVTASKNKVVKTSLVIAAISGYLIVLAAVGLLVVKVLIPHATILSQNLNQPVSLIWLGLGLAFLVLYFAIHFLLILLGILARHACPIQIVSNKEKR